MNREQVLQAFLDYLDATTGLGFGRSVPMDADGVDLTQPHVLVKVQQDVPDGLPDEVERVDDGALVVDTLVRRRAMLLVEGRGAAIEDAMASALDRLLGTGAAATALRDAGVHVQRVGALQDVSAYLRTSTEPRFQATVEVAFGRTYLADPVDDAAAFVVGVAYTRQGTTAQTDEFSVEAP